MDLPHPACLSVCLSLFPGVLCHRSLRPVICPCSSWPLTVPLAPNCVFSPFRGTNHCPGAPALPPRTCCRVKPLPSQPHPVHPLKCRASVHIYPSLEFCTCCSLFLPGTLLPPHFLLIFQISAPEASLIPHTDQVHCPSLSHSVYPGLCDIYCHV